MDLDVSTFTIKQLEAEIHKRGDQITALRAEMRGIHRVLELKQQEARAAELRARPADFPKAQNIGTK